LEILHQDSLEAIGLADGIAEAVQTAVAVIVCQEGLSQGVTSLAMEATGAVEGQGDAGRRNGGLPAAEPFPQ